jgi:hypothetical protein
MTAEMITGVMRGPTATASFSEGVIASMPREVGFVREALSQKHRKAVV